MTAWLARAAVAAAALAALAACRAEEQGRPLTYEKGVYRGVQDTALNDETRMRLKERALFQAGLEGEAAGLPPSGIGPSVRPPTDSRG